MAAASNTVTISCRCGAARQTVSPRGNKNIFSDVTFCHCDTCRHVTGLLCAPYALISSSPPPSCAALSSYPTSPTSTRHFCSTCGCHVFRSDRPSPSAPPEEWAWEVATGVIVEAPESDDINPNKSRHIHVQDTKDGGLSIWLPNGSSPPPAPTSTNTSTTTTTRRTADDNDTLHASCHCTAITLTITRPAPDPSTNPDSPFPDLLLPYVSTPQSTISNPSHEKWYLRPTPDPTTTTTTTTTTDKDKDKDGSETEKKPKPTRYLAGTCACASCRTTSGFEIQTWAFIPRRNISIISTTNNSNNNNPTAEDRSSGSGTSNPTPLDFTTASTPLKTYESSPDVFRDFCSRCGATVFWHAKHRPDLVDVSAGLLRAREGARAESWLEWWTGRVSFAEEAGNGRRGGAKAWAERVVQGLEDGLRSQHGARWDGTGRDETQSQ
ncbi:hypothetical protein VTK56DRAFT_8352 [Thermocarpiscus australiensis]